MHHAVAVHIEHTYKKTLRNYYGTLSYHYRNTINYRNFAFKYTVKAADYALSIGAFSDGFAYLEIAEPLAKYDVEAQMLYEVVTAGIDDLKTKYGFSDKSAGCLPAMFRGNVELSPDIKHLIESYKNLELILQDKVQLLKHSTISGLSNTSDSSKKAPTKSSAKPGAKSSLSIDAAASMRYRAKVQEDAPPSIRSPIGGTGQTPPKLHKLNWQVSYVERKKKRSDCYVM